MKALLLTEPHARWIYEGKKKLFLKRRHYDITGKTFALVSTEGTAYGIIKPTQCFQITYEQFLKLMPEHKVSAEEMKNGDWKFPLWAYEFDFKPFKEIKEVIIKNILPERMVELIKSVKAPNNQLADDWRIVCAWYRRIKEKKQFIHSEEDVLNLARIIYQEITKRVKAGMMKHEFKPEEMSPATRELYEKVQKPVIGEVRASERDYAPINPSKDHNKGREISKEEVIDNWRKPIKLVEDFITVIGGVCSWGKTTGDIDVLLKMPDEDNFLKTPLIFRLYRAQPEDIADRLHFVSNIYEGPFTDHAHLYDLVLVPKEDIRIEQMSEEELMAKPFAMPGGKKFQAKFLCKILPKHKTYVEPFAGGAAVFYEKEPSEIEVLNDINKDIMDFYSSMKHLTDDEIKQLKAKNWKPSEQLFARVKNMKPTNNVDKVYRLAYLMATSYASEMQSYSFDKRLDIVCGNFPKRIEAYRERLKNVKLFRADYKKVMNKFDSKDTVFYLDPPYQTDSTQNFIGSVPSEELFKVCKSIKGKFILSHSDPELAKSLRKIGCKVVRIHPKIRFTGGTQKKTRTEFTITNFNYETRRALAELEAELDEIRLQRTTTNPEIVIQAKQSAEEDKVIPFRFFLQMKPMHGRKPEEFYTPEIVLRTLYEEVPDWKTVGVYVGRKADGVTCQFHKVKDKIRVWIEDGGEITNQIPSIIKSLSFIRHDFVSIGEIEAWKDKKHLPRAISNGILHSKEVGPDEKKLKVAMYDIFYLDGKDIHNESYLERRKKLELFEGLEKVWLNPNFLAETDSEVISLINKCKELDYSEGAILNVADQKYSLALKPTGKFMKFKNEFSLVAKVIGKRLVKGTEKTWFYFCAIQGNAFVGKTFNSNVQANVGDKIEVIFVDISAYKVPDTGKYWFRWWSPRVKGISDKPISSVQYAMQLVKKTTGRIEEKPLPKFEEIKALPEGVMLQIDPFMEIPEEKTSKTYKFVMQHHYRAGLPHDEAQLSSVHTDFRLEVDDYLVGWTIADQIEGKVTDIRTMSEARTADKKTEMFKIDWDTGKFKIHETRAGHKVRRSLYAAKKAREPRDWLEYQGVVQPGTVGATRYGEGVFTIIDKGTLEVGAQKPYFHEYFLHGYKLKGRLLLRQLPIQQYKKVGREEYFWLCIQPLEQEPYVLSLRAENEGWLPPKGISALPEYVRNQIPKELQYWNMDKAKALETRKEIRRLVKQNKIVFKELMLDASAKQIPFWIQHHWFKGQTVIRAAPTNEHWDFIFDFGKTPYPRYICEYNPLEIPETSAIYKSLDKKCFEAHTAVGYGKTVYAPPKTILNPTKNTKAWLKTVDSGTCIFLDNLPDFKKIQFKGKHLKGLYTFKKKPEEIVWIFSKSQLPQPELSAEFMGKDSDYLKITGLFLHRGFIKSKNFRVMDDELRKIVLEPLPNHRLCYVDLFHLKGDPDKVGVLNKVWFDENYEWRNEETGQMEKGAALYEAFIFNPDAMEKIANSEFKFTSGEIRYGQSPDEPPFATNIKAHGLGLVLDPAVKEARIATAQDQNTFVKFLNSMQIVRINNNAPLMV